MRIAAIILAGFLRIIGAVRAWRKAAILRSMGFKVDVRRQHQHVLVYVYNDMGLYDVYIF
jgi:hypothetical protein